MDLVIRDLSKRFGRVLALDRVSLALPAGSRTALIGPNGSGKSTLVRALLGMLAVDGELLADGQPVADRRAELARAIAYVPQIAPRLAAPVRDVVRAVAALRGIAVPRVEALARELGVELAGLAARPFRALSGGQRQKVLAALALAADAPFLVLDEPTASMDPQSRAVFFRLVEGLATATTVLLCSHRLDEIRRLVDRVVVLQEGRLAWSGPAAAYLDDHAEAVVEVCVAAGAAEAWLRERGFQPGTGGWWSRSLPVGERAHLIGEIGRSLNGQVRDVLARDIERLQSKGDLR